MKVYRIIDGVETPIYDIMEASYSGKDMGERVITAKISAPEVIDFKIGDFVKLDMQNLLRLEDSQSGSIEEERFYIYNMPTIKKTARKDSCGDAFEMTVMFYPRQYELGLVQMRDFVQQNGSGRNIIYTGFDKVTFYGGAHELMTRIQACLDEYCKAHEIPQAEWWSYVLADEVNETINPALESFTFTFSGNKVMDALLKLNDPEGINTTFFINNRTIYVGFKRPYLCRVAESEQGDVLLSREPFNFAYGKTSHLPIDHQSGGLFELTKAAGKESPITKLYAYGGTRNISRYYDADVLRRQEEETQNRYVNRLMLPSFSRDGKTDYILASQERRDMYGIREDSKEFEDVFPSIENIRYGYIRGIKYCIKILTSYNNSIMCIQCYRVEPIIKDGQDSGINHLVEAYPPEDLAIFIHAYQEGDTARGSKTIRCVLYGGATAEEALIKQKAADGQECIPYRVVEGVAEYIPGSCYAVHDDGFDGVPEAEKHHKEWFEYDEDSQYQLHKVDDFWASDLHVFKGYNSDIYIKDGYSLYCYPRVNVNYKPDGNSVADDSLLVNEIIAVTPITKIDSVDGNGSQPTFDIFLRDIGFAIDEQSLQPNDENQGVGTGQMVFINQGDVVINFKTGNLAGLEFNIDGSGTSGQSNGTIMCAFNEDGSENEEFFKEDETIARQAVADGAVWRIRLNRQAADETHKADYYLPNIDCNAQAGDRVVILNISMPDIYVSAAEKKLEEEAWKYLDKNCKDSTSYTMQFDKVRFQQIPLYALQMREGVNARIIDEDLKVQMENTIRNKYKTTSESFENIKMWGGAFVNYVNEKFKYGGGDGAGIISYDDETKTFTMKAPSEYGIGIGKLQIQTSFRTVDMTVSNVTYSGGFFRFNAKPVDEKQYNSVKEHSGGYWVIVYEKKLVEGEPLSFDNCGLPINANTGALIDFLPKKIYDVIVDIDNRFLQSGTFNPIMLSNNISGDVNSLYNPTYTAVVDNEAEVAEGYTRVKYTFELPENFNDNTKYYPIVEYIADGINSYAGIRLVSVTEKDFDTEEEILKYKDFIVEQVTINIQDNTRDDDLRLVKLQPEAIKDITATLSEKTRGSGWVSLNNQIEELKNESDKTQQSLEVRARNARENAFNLNSLRDHIFDPDASLDRYEKCSPDFLRKMMLQIGADSMNFQMDKTYQGVDGTLHNCILEYSQQYSCYVFSASNDILRHFVFNRADGQANWNITGNSKQLVASGEVYPVYYIALKCSISDGTGQWVIDTQMHSVNEDSNYFYFNWGILTPDSNGYYTLQETRGCAYMYGDNLVVGKIKDLSGHSYFDLTNGNFVLSTGDLSGAALSYVNGKLTIKGVSDQKIGGENLCNLPAQYIENDFMPDNQRSFELVIGMSNKEFEAGSYVYDFDNISVLITRNGGIPVSNHIVMSLKDEDGNKIADVSADDLHNKAFTLESACELRLHIEIYIDDVYTGTTSKLEIDNAMIQMGTKATGYKPYVDHLTDALKGSTEIAGGLLMTNVLMLKDNKNGTVTAGMSGVQGEGENKEDVLLWGGGTYEKALQQIQGLIDELPVLLTKAGKNSKIGPFKVLENGIEIKTNEGRIVFDKNGICLFRDDSDVAVVSITPALLEPQASGSYPFTINPVAETSLLMSSGQKEINLSNNLSIDKSGMILTISNLTVDVYVPAFNGLREYIWVYLDLLYAAPGETYYSRVWSKELFYADEWWRDGAIYGTINVNEKMMYYSKGNYLWQIRFVQRSKKHNGDIYVDPSQYLHYTIRNTSSGIIDSHFTDTSGNPTIQIRKDGIRVFQNATKYIEIKNSGSDISFKAPGLPTNPSSLESGTIYNDGGVLKIKQ